jgi:putative endonuclease
VAIVPTTDHTARPTSARSGHRGSTSRRTLGSLGEQAAAEHLERLGYSILARNVRTRHGEIDLIAFGEGAIVFVEVKSLASRTSPTAGPVRPLPEPLVGLRARQRARVRRLAAAWLADEARERPHAETIRFDAVGVVFDRSHRLLCLEHIEAAW